MEEEKIVLDRQSFEALAVDTRVKILKSLKQRRKTLSELAREQSMSVSGIKEHLETLEKVGLIEKIDDGHKWKYYELTKKGNDIVAPKELRVWILLSVSAFALIVSMFALLAAPLAPQPEGELMMAKATAPAPEAAGTMVASDEPAMPPTAMNDGAEDRSMNAQDADFAPDEAVPEEPGQRDLSVPLAIAVISGLTVIGCISILVGNRMRAASR